jgi:hypothetical protein
MRHAPVGAPHKRQGTADAPHAPQAGDSPRRAAALRQRSYSTEYMPPPCWTRRGVPPLASGMALGMAVS